MITRICVGSLILCCSLTADAQISQQSASPTETDLHAAYCIEVNRGFISLYQEMFKAAVPDDGGPASKSIKDEMTGGYNTAVANLKRLQAYLIPRLTFIDALGLAGAQAAAKSDFSRVGAASNTCTAQCDAPSCTAACISKAMPDLASVQKKLAMCRELEWLPF